ncbi:AEC family transporter [Benzoatithermus flavus]|uniref:AEC family transporter n=1 Tax=Benzoatithermus flavus TaxID=3108223 RepID=A0ABU8XM36_9PROT
MLGRDHRRGRRRVQRQKEVSGPSLEPRRRLRYQQLHSPSEVPPIAVVIDIIAPIFGIVLIGWLAARFGAIDEAAGRGLSLFAFNFAIPVMLVRTLAEAALPPHPEWRFVLAYFGGAFANFGLAAFLARRLFGRERAEPAIFGITAAFSNTTILGIPLILQAYGEPAAVPLSLILGFHSALLFTLTTVVAELGVGAGSSLGRMLANILKGLVTNPILWGIGIGLVLNHLGLALPSVLDRLATTLGAAALPAALFALGANLSRFRLMGSLREALLLTFLKILAQPALIWLLAKGAFALPPLSTAIAVTIGALPSGINAYLFAARYRAAVPEATSTILLSTLVSVVTVGLLLTVLRH